MHTDESQNFGRRVLTCIENFDLNVLQLVVLANKLKASVTLLAQVLVTLKYTDKTKAMKEKSRQRGEIFVSLRKMLEAITLQRNQANADLANMLLDVIRQHGWDLHTLSYAKQSSRIADLINHIETNQSLSLAITTLNLSELLAELKLAQSEFETIEQSRTILNADKPATTGSTASKEVKDTCVELFQAIDSLYNLTQKPEYLEMANRINEVVDAQAQIIRTRITRAAEKDDDKTTT